MQSNPPSRRHLLSTFLAGLLGCLSLGTSHSASPPPLATARDPATSLPSGASSASGAEASLSYAAQDLPPGLSLNPSTGVISGTAKG
jgi:hypothetical protein